MSTTKIVSKLGFTLIELMVVVSIIGVLMAAGILAFSNAQQNARDAKRRADVDAIGKALEQYYGDNASYPASQSALTDFFPSGSLPTDPQGSNYDIKLAAGGDAYCICATLEKPGRGNASAVGNGSGVCNYEAGGDYFCTSQRQ